MITKPRWCNNIHWPCGEKTTKNNLPSAVLPRCLGWSAGPRNCVCRSIQRQVPPQELEQPIVRNWSSSSGLFHTHDGSMVLLYMVCHGSHQYIPFMLAYIPAPWILWDMLYKLVVPQWAVHVKLVRANKSNFTMVVDMSIPGWWFGTWILFFHILGISSSQLTSIFFSGVGIPPTSYSYSRIPICSMYGIFTTICPKNHPNVDKYTTHGAYGIAFPAGPLWAAPLQVLRKHLSLTETQTCRGCLRRSRCKFFKVDIAGRGMFMGKNDDLNQQKMGYVWFIYI